MNHKSWGKLSVASEGGGPTTAYFGFTNANSGGFAMPDDANGVQYLGGYFQIVDATPPTIKIISPTNGQQIASADFVVSGTASDNVSVTNVYFQILGDTDWTEADTTNNYSNWTGNITFTTPGTNIIQAYAVDSSGNPSATNNVTIVLTTGSGDTQSPICSVTNLTNGQNVGNASYTAMGTVSDNFQLDSVRFQLNGGSWSNAVPSPGWANWSAVLNLIYGTNYLLVYAKDAAGNSSMTNSVTFEYVVPFTFTTNNGVITITGYTGSNGLVSIPSIINGFPVTSIGFQAFLECTILRGLP
jgi:hypothetical protein